MSNSFAERVCPALAGSLTTTLVFWIVFVSASVASAAERHADVVIYGATPGGIAAGVAARRESASVIIIEPSRWIGGMVAGGLSSTDLGRVETIGGLAREFFTRAAQAAPNSKLWYTEPHVNLQTFEALLKESKIEVVRGQHLTAVKLAGRRIQSITTNQGETFSAATFIDATYEGDLMAKAAVSYAYGRESQSQYGEPLAGFRLEQPRGFTLETMTKGCPCVGDDGPHYVHGAPTKIAARDSAGALLWGVAEHKGTPGEADHLTQSYNFRFCATQRPDLLVPWPKPARYDAKRYELLLRLVEAYPGIPFSRLVHLGQISGGKVDLNAQGLFSTDYVGGNFAYQEADAATREQIRQDHIDYLQGFFWFLGHDPRVPEKLRTETNSWGLCRDEFVDNDHWPYALYVREARRMKGAYIMRQADTQRDIRKPDGIAMGSFIIDSHIVQRLVDDEGNVIDEGAFDAPSRPYQIPYRSLTPQPGECENLLVPVCLSASHVAYCSIRMEPVYMACGHAAGLAAAIAGKQNIAVQAINVSDLQQKLKAQQAVLDIALPGTVWKQDLPGVVSDDEDAERVGVWVFSTYAGGGVDGAARHDANSGKGQKSARYRLTPPQAGRYEVRVSYSPAPNRATNVPISIEHVQGTGNVTLNQQLAPTIDKLFASLGVFEFSPEHPAVVTIGTTATNGYVVIDAVQLVPVK